MSRPETSWWRQITFGTTQDEFPSLNAFADATSTETAHHVALAWVFDQALTSILLIEHRSMQWSCPGGHLEPGETLVAAARRELAEETGIIESPFAHTPLTLARSIGCPRSQRADTVHWASGFAFLVDRTTPIVTEPDQRACWFRMAELPPARAPDIDVVVNQVIATTE